MRGAARITQYELQMHRQGPLSGDPFEAELLRPFEREAGAELRLTIVFSHASDAVDLLERLGEAGIGGAERSHETALVLKR